MAIFKLFQLTVILLLGRSSGRLATTSRKNKDAMASSAHRELPPGQMGQTGGMPGKKGATRRPTQSPTIQPTSQPSSHFQSSETDSDKSQSNQSPKGGPGGPTPKSQCSLLPSIARSGPQGAKLQLFGSCTQVDALPLYNGVISYGSCNLYAYMNQTNNLGIFRYSVEAVFGLDSYMQIQYTAIIFVGYPYQVVLTGSALSPTAVVQGPYLWSPTTLSIINVVIDQGLSNQNLDDCRFSNYKKAVYTFAVNEKNVNFTFF